MSDWDFLWDENLSGEELYDAISSGGTESDWAYVAEQERQEQKKEWEKLKALRDNGRISKEEFKKRKTALFSNDINY